MFLKQYYLGCLAHASYLVADPRTKRAVVVDPQRDVEQYLDDARRLGFTIGQVVLTHFHADFLAGHIELRNRVGAEILLGSRAEAEFAFTPLSEGDTIDLGDVHLQVLETPGHTPEGISLVVYASRAADQAPQAVLTGDTLFIGDVGRPDLLASIGVSADELAEMLYHSLTKLRELPDDVLVYPAHGAGSMCGKNLSTETVSPLGEQKRFNYALQPMSLDEFKSLVMADQPDAPDYFVYDAIKNRQERPDLDTTMTLALKPLGLAEVLKLRNQGAQVLDVREANEFAGAHLDGSLNIGLRGQFATWCGAMLSHSQPIVVIGDPDTEGEAIMRLGRIGFDNAVGYLQGGMAALEAYPEHLATTERVPVAVLAQELASPEAPLVVDVRTEEEHAGGHIPGSRNIPLMQLKDRWRELPTDQTIVVHCAGGYRSAVASSLLAAHGLPVRDLVGGVKAWSASKLGLQTPAHP